MKADSNIQMKKKKDADRKIGRNIPWILFVFVILTINALYWCGQKEGYYIDELWSYGLSNSYYSPFLHQNDNYMNQWHQPAFYENYLTVKPNEAFSYDSVYYNQAHDVHPPFYYMLLHTICSLFPNHFSKWSGLMINLLFFWGSIFLLYKISGMILGETKGVRLIPPLLYGLSMGAVSTLIYIRMYMTLTFCTLLFVFLSFFLIKSLPDKKRFLLLTAIGAAATAGFLTQYYFVIFIFFFSIGYVIWNMMIRQWRRIAEYSLAVCAGITSGIFLFPSSLYHIFLGQQGKRAFTNASNDIHLFLNHWLQYQNTIIKEFFGNEHIAQVVLFIAFCILTTTVIYSMKKKSLKLNIWNTVSKAECLLLFYTVLCYFAVITQISPEISDRYQFIIYPFCVLLAASVTVYLFRQLKKEWMIWIAAANCLLLILRAYTLQPVPYVYEGYHEVMDKLGTEYKNVLGIYVTAGDHLLINNCLFLAQQETTYSLSLEQLNEIPNICEGLDTKQLVLYVDIYYDELQTAKQVAKLLDYQSCSLLYDNTFTQIYLLSRCD